ncbi:hypothetical protein [Bacillus atrophaeus]|uniref:Uncharacterized protein n=2 Tax=Bacillus atrophaeus TaxID=1452 RepID=A0ABM5LZD2_BACA1|nr:hypothetical protein [Bacillus atrophaeus]AMR62059.1 hypothetical protein A1D11_06460 [Bacillus subtilis subsp. globigii]ADP33172.1 hypothetical protein BATR1942_11205 [Bacillus atrophaeus 1942]AIK48240.1 hypothetical protein DJ95_2125 [Bacillus atrophaeus subsp. globigii]EIM12391.1 hypothetical protein UY9_02116 [Bacillus atrophaeus C89]KFK82491.1 hypothetical protein DK44_1508 [Bacillus atrophaeus]
MKNIEKIFNALKELNEKYNHTLISTEELLQEEENIIELTQIDVRMNKVLAKLSQIEDKEKLTSALLQLHLVIGDIEWQFDQIHEMVRQVIENIED